VGRDKRNKPGTGEKGDTRVLAIRLPADHPVFTLPERERSRVAREWLDRGRDITLSLDAIIREIRDIRLRVSSGSANLQPMAASEPEESRRPKIDVNEFLKAFE